MAILEDDRLVELLVDRPDLRRTVGDLYRGRVEAVLPGMQAAFVDIGTEKSGFLHASDLVEPDVEELEDEDSIGNSGGNGRGRSRSSARYPNVSDVLTRGQILTVQVTKEAISTKGPRVTTQISLPGRFLVYMPHSSKIGVSRKIESRQERARLREIVSKHLPKDAGGVIVRTVARDVEASQIKRELKSLLNLWKKIKRKEKVVKPPAPIQREGSLTSGIVRDLFTDKVDKLYVDSKQVHREIKQYLKDIDADLLDRVQLYSEETPIFDKYDIETEIRGLFKRRVDLPAGGYVIIEPTEALISIDVNTGRYTGRHDPEKTMLRTNLEAAREIARQLRLRDIGGIVVIDFIDMGNQRNRDKVLQELRAHLSRDRARTRAFRVSDLGLVEMTRQRVRPSLLNIMTEACPSCGGDGRVFRPEVVIRRLERAIKRAGRGSEERNMVVKMHPEVALYLLEQEPHFLRGMGRVAGIDVEIRDDPTILQDEFRMIIQPAGRDVTDRYAVA